MSTNWIRRGHVGIVLAIVVGGLLWLPSGASFSQEPTGGEAAVETVVEDAPEAPAAETGADQPAVVEEAVSNESAPSASTEAEAESKPATGTPGLGPFELGVIIIALFVLPIMAGNYLANRLRMPDYGWKISLVIGSLAAAAVVVSLGQFKFGPDLAGGITLIYELAEPDTGTDEDAAAQRGSSIDMGEMIEILKRRVDPSGTREITVREYGPAIEIIIPETGEDALQYIKRRITELGQLEFRITADPTQSKDVPIIEQALLLPPSQKDVLLNDEKVGEWVTYAEDEFGPPEEEDRRVVKRMAGDTPEALVLIDRMNVTGEYLTSATKGVGPRGGPAVHFSFNSTGARRFRQLTSQNRPNQATGAVRYLGIVLDKRLISAPSINETISDRGQISGESMNEEEVEHIVSILREGRLPLELNKEPISEETISPTLGAVTVQKGKYAIAVSLVAVLLFMWLYYRFSGFVSCMALTANLLLVLAVMVLIQAAFTLPGLAGLVLTIGMSVDANVLIFERIREELNHGAALRMAIRNGFGRATTTIVDANVTTIISGIALYVIGTDQVKGFAVTLILGILMSMYTAIFCSRIVFDIAERRGWIRTLKMNRALGETNFNFLQGTVPAIVLSLVLIGIGVVAVVHRGSALLDIDFTGGSSVTFALKHEHRKPIGDVRAALLETQLAERNLVVVERGKTQDRYTVDTSEQSVDEVKRILREKFAGDLLTYSLDVTDVKPIEESGFPGTEAVLVANKGADFSDDDGVSHDALLERVRSALAQRGLGGTVPMLTNPYYRPGSSARYKEWTVRLGSVDQDTAQSVLEQLKQQLESTPLFPLANKIGGRVSKNMQLQAGYAIFVSLLGIVGYLWLRFQQVTFGVAAAIALVHDVLVAIGALAVSSYIVKTAPALASALLLDAFQINLTIVAALLTIMGYSLNDTIVTFDRVREVRGKSPDLTADMVNKSINQTLSRTLLTSLTTLIVVAILYVFGGDGVHGFAFSVVVGVFVGTYSSIYIASPVLVWLNGQSVKTTRPVEQSQTLEAAR